MTFIKTINNLNRKTLLEIIRELKEENVQLKAKLNNVKLKHKNSDLVKTLIIEFLNEFHSLTSTQICEKIKENFGLDYSRNHISRMCVCLLDKNQIIKKKSPTFKNSVGRPEVFWKLMR